MSVRTDAIDGGNVHSSDVYAWPNPVRPDYDGPIAIRGLARDAVVKITDIRGQILYETRALGGQAIWDGKDLNGSRQRPACTWSFPLPQVMVIINRMPWSLKSLL